MKVVWQYYNHENKCIALDCYSSNCICWWDEGTGVHPLTSIKEECGLTWREKTVDGEEGVGEKVTTSVDLEMWFRVKDALLFSKENAVELLRLSLTSPEIQVGRESEEVIKMYQRDVAELKEIILYFEKHKGAVL